jgi:hypothetical protein
VVAVMVAAVAAATVAFTAASCVDRSAAERAAGPASGAVVFGTHPDRAGDRIGDVVTLRGHEGVIIVED